MNFYKSEISLLNRGRPPSTMFERRRRRSNACQRVTENVTLQYIGTHAHTDTHALDLVDQSVIGEYTYGCSIRRKFDMGIDIRWRSSRTHCNLPAVGGMFFWTGTAPVSLRVRMCSSYSRLAAFNSSSIICTISV